MSFKICVLCQISYVKIIIPTVDGITAAHTHFLQHHKILHLTFIASYYKQAYYHKSFCQLDSILNVRFLFLRGVAIYIQITSPKMTYINDLGL